MRPIAVAGIDSSTQNCKLVVHDAATGAVLKSRAVPHPDGTELDPREWWSAFEALDTDSIDGLGALSITAQQHSTIFLDETGRPVRPALLWNDTRASEAAGALRAELPREDWLERVGLIPNAAHPVSKLRWMRDVEPRNADRTSHVMVPHDWLTWRLLGAREDPTTDRSDASCTGYWSSVSGAYDSSIAELALGRAFSAPRVLGPDATAGTIASGALVAAGCGDNAGTALGLSAGAGEAVVSVGTSLTVTTIVEDRALDVRGVVDDMADAAGRHLPIVATLNGARTLIAVARMLRVSPEQLDELAREADPDADGLVFVPYLDGERNPDLPTAAGALLGLTRRSMRPENVARSAFLGMAAVAANGIDHLERIGASIEKIVVVGGGSRSSQFRSALADLSDRPVEYPAHAEYAARGAARQAAWALTGELPHWPREVQEVDRPSRRRSWVDDFRARYAESTTWSGRSENVSPSC